MAPAARDQLFERNLLMSTYRRKRVLFICIGNACRSPMAEAIAGVDAPDTIDAFSAGLAPIGFVAEMTKRTLRRNGYWMNTPRSKIGRSRIPMARIPTLISESSKKFDCALQNWLRNVGRMTSEIGFHQRPLRVIFRDK